MRILFLIFFLSCLGICKAQEHNLSLHPYVNWKKEDLRWTIAGTEQGTNPNILSELDWSGLIGPQIGLKANIPLTSRLFFELDANYQRIHSGKVVDTDYAGDNRLYTTSQLLLKANDGQVIETKAKLIYLAYQKNGWRLLPQLGYWGKYQTLYMLDGLEPLIPGRHLRSTYKPRWYGLSAGMSVGYSVGQWDGELALHAVGILQYQAEANWNLQDDFQQPLSFKHNSNAGGLDARFNLSYQLQSNVYVTTHMEYTNLQAGKGEDELYYADGRVVRTQLNGVYARSLAAGLGIKYLLR